MSAANVPISSLARSHFRTSILERRQRSPLRYVRPLYSRPMKREEVTSPQSQNSSRLLQTPSISPQRNLRPSPPKYLDSLSYQKTYQKISPTNSMSTEMCSSLGHISTKTWAWIHLTPSTGISGGRGAQTTSALSISKKHYDVRL